MRVCIIGLDALEYDLVEKFGLNNLKQKEYGKVNVSSFNMLATPIIWTSFLTGLPPKEHGVTAFYIWDKKWARTLRKISAKLGLGRIHNKGKILEKSGLAHKRMHEKEDLKEKGIKPIFNYAKHPIALSVAAYNEDAYLSIGRKLLEEYFKGKATEEEIIKHAWRSFEEKKKRLFKTLDSGTEWDLLMFYEHGVTDLLGHLFRGNLAVMWEVYAQMDSFVKNLKERIGDEVFTLIISDHGMRPVSEYLGRMGRYGDHSKYGFYSSNIPLNLDFPKITDFKGIILEKLRE